MRPTSRYQVPSSGRVEGSTSIASRSGPLPPRETRFLRALRACVPVLEASTNPPRCRCSCCYFTECYYYCCYWLVLLLLVLQAVRPLLLLRLVLLVVLPGCRSVSAYKNRVLYTTGRRGGTALCNSCGSSGGGSSCNSSSSSRTTEASARDCGLRSNCRRWPPSLPSARVQENSERRLV